MQVTTTEETAPAASTDDTDKPLPPWLKLLEIGSVIISLALVVGAGIWFYSTLTATHGTELLETALADAGIAVSSPLEVRGSANPYREDAFVCGLDDCVGLEQIDTLTEPTDLVGSTSYDLGGVDLVVYGNNVPEWAEFGTDGHWFSLTSGDAGSLVRVLDQMIDGGVSAS